MVSIAFYGVTTVKETHLTGIIFIIIGIVGTGEMLLRKSKLIDERETYIAIASAYGGVITTLTFIIANGAIEMIRFGKISSRYVTIMLVLISSQAVFMALFNEKKPKEQTPSKRS